MGCPGEVWGPFSWVLRPARGRTNQLISNWIWDLLYWRTFIPDIIDLIKSPWLKGSKALEVTIIYLYCWMNMLSSCLLTNYVCNHNLFLSSALVKGAHLCSEYSYYGHLWLVKVPSKSDYWILRLKQKTHITCWKFRGHHSRADRKNVRGGW